MIDGHPPTTHGPGAGARDAPVQSLFPGDAEGCPFSLLTPETAPEQFEVELASQDGPGEILRFDAPIVVIGRAPGCDLRLPDPDVSGRHAVLVAAGGRYLAIDLGGRTGLFVNRRPAAFGWFGLGDELSVGPFRLVCRSDAAAAPPPHAASALFSRHPAPPARLTLRLPRPAGPPADVSIDRPVTLVGRSRACKIRLTDRSVSKVHAGLILTPGGLVAVDLLSRQGVVVNGRTRKAAPLAAGDHLRIGVRWLEIVDGGDDAAAVSGASVAPARGGRPAPETASPADSSESTAPSPVPEQANPAEAAPRLRTIGATPAAAGDGPSRIDTLVAALSGGGTALSGDGAGWSAAFLRDAVDTLLRLPEDPASAELERLGDLSARLAELRAAGPASATAGGPARSVELLEAEWEHSRRVVLSLVVELTGRGVEG